MAARSAAASSALLSEARVAGDIEKADRRRSLEAAVEPRLRQQHLEAFDQVGGPGARLLGVVHGQDSLFREWGTPIGELRVGHLLRAMARGHSRRDHLGVPPGGLRFGDPTGAVAVNAEQPLDGDRPKSGGDLQLKEGHDPHLVLAQPIVG
ncbi:MAG: hypothetical protein ACLQHS_12925 [Candidatus Limnocylindrales bacterium]